MVFNFRIGAFCNLHLILHKVEQKKPTNYPLQILCIPHFTIVPRYVNLGLFVLHQKNHQ